MKRWREGWRGVEVIRSRWNGFTALNRLHLSNATPSLVMMGRCRATSILASDDSNFMQTFIWQHCDAFVKVSPTSVDQNVLLSRYQMVFNVISSCIHIAKETKATYGRGEWLSDYQKLFSELTNSFASNSWRSELYRLKYVSDTGVYKYKHDVKNILKSLEMQTIRIAEGSNVREIEGEIVAKFADIILSSEVFSHEPEYEHVPENCSVLIKNIDKMQTQDTDYYLVRLLATALIRERDILNAASVFPFSEEEWNKQPQFMNLVNQLKQQLSEFIAEEPLVPLYYTTRKRIIAHLPYNTPEQAEQILSDCKILLYQLKQTNDIDTIADKAIAESELGNYQEAEKDCNLALSINPFRPDLLFRLVAFDFIRGDYMNGLMLMNDVVYTAQQSPNRGTDLSQLHHYKTECISLCRDGITDNALYEIVLTLIESRMLLVSPPTESIEELDNLFKSLIKLCTQKVETLYPKNVELLCAIEMLNTLYSLQVQVDTRDIEGRLERICSLLPFNPAVHHFIGVSYFKAFQIESSKPQDTNSNSYLIKSMNALTKSIQISRSEEQPQFRYKPYRTMASIAAVTVYLEDKTDQDRISICTDGLRMLEYNVDYLMVPLLLQYRSSFYERSGALIQALVDLDRLLQIQSLNVQALKKRMNILKKLKLRHETVVEDEAVLSELLENPL